MAATPPTSIPQAPARRSFWRRWWRTGVLLAVLVIGAPSAFYIYTILETRNAWDEAEAEAARDLPRWRLLELEADRPAVPDAENSGLHMMAIKRKVAAFAVYNAPNYDKIFENLPPTAQLNAQQTDLLRTELAKDAKSLVEARKLKDMPRGRYPIVYSDDGYSTLIPHHQETRGFAGLLQNDAFLLAQEGECDRALESCRAILHASRVVETDLFLIALLIRVALQQMTVTTLERVLAQGQATEGPLQAMQAALARDRDNSSWVHAVRGERAALHHLFENIRAGKVTQGWYFGGPSDNTLEAIEVWFAERFPSTILRHYPEFLSNMNRCVEIGKLPTHERLQKYQAWEADCRASRNPLIRRFLPAMAKVHLAECRSQALLRSATVALACERYRLRHKAWPATLEVLVQEKLLDAVPADPFDNQPLRYRRTKDGIVVYSVGVDLTDNHGNIDPEHPHNPGVDIGFRLWNPKRRRQDPLPPVVIPD
jgi:hypothetical protein